MTQVCCSLCSQSAGTEGRTHITVFENANFCNVCSDLIQENFPGIKSGEEGSGSVADFFKTLSTLSVDKLVSHFTNFGTILTATSKKGTKRWMLGYALQNIGGLLSLGQSGVSALASLIGNVLGGEKQTKKK